MEQETYNYLQELSDSDFQIVDEQPNIIGWEVRNESGTYIGVVNELLFEPRTLAVRYLVVDLEENNMNLEHKQIMIPLGIAHLHTNEDQVVLPGLHFDQFNALPVYDKEHISPELEVQIRSIIGSPAALRLEETITAFDQTQFYNHHHFDKGRFYTRGGAAPAHTVHPEETELAPHIGQMGERTEEKETIHQLVEQSPITIYQNENNMENNNEIISDLKGLINILNDGKEGYESAAETTESSELKSLFMNFSAQRAAFADELKAHIAQHGGESDNDSGGVLGALHRSWIDIKQALTSQEDAAILGAIETGEKAAIEKFDQALEDPSTHADHLNLLQKQRTGIREALSEIETYHHRLDNLND